MDTDSLYWPLHAARPMLLLCFTTATTSNILLYFIFWSSAWGSKATDGWPATGRSVWSVELVRLGFV